MVAEPEHNNHTYAQHHADRCSNPGIALRDAVACPKYLHVQINHGGNGLGIGRYRGEQLGPYENPTLVTLHMVTLVLNTPFNSGNVI